MDRSFAPHDVCPSRPSRGSAARCCALPSRGEGRSVTWTIFPFGAVSCPILSDTRVSSSPGVIHHYHVPHHYPHHHRRSCLRRRHPRLPPPIARPHAPPD